MGHEPCVIPQAVQRRLELAFARFTYDRHAGAWRRGSLTLAEELIDTVDDDTWQASLHQWAHDHAHCLEEGGFMNRALGGETRHGDPG